MNHGRKYGEKESHPVPIWNGIFEHYERIGDALWEFEKCIDWITEERDGIGIVLGGKPVKVSEIVAAIRGSKKETVRRHMDLLEREKLIRRRRTPYGHVIEVLNSQKFGIWRKEKPQNGVSQPGEKPINGSEKPTGGSEKPKNNINKEDTAVTQQKEAAGRCLAVWKFLGVDGSRWAPTIREVCENLYRAKNGQAPVDLIGACMDGIEALGAQIPPALARRAAELRSQGRVVAHEPIPELEAEPWAS